MQQLVSECIELRLLSSTRQETGRFKRRGFPGRRVTAFERFLNVSRRSRRTPSNSTSDFVQQAARAVGTGGNQPVKLLSVVDGFASEGIIQFS